MPTINQLASTDTLSVSDQFPVYSAANGDARKASGTALLAFVEANFASPDYTTVLVAPTVSGFVQPIGNTSDNVWLIINAATDLAAGTVQLPPASSAIDGQQVLVTSQNAITTLTVTSSGATVSGAPSGLADAAFFAMRYSASMTTWYCVAMVLTGLNSFSTITLTSDSNTIKDVNGQTSLQLTRNYAGVTAGNFLEITNRSTGSPPQINARGVDTDIGISLQPKGNGQLTLSANGPMVIAGDANSTVNLTGTLQINASPNTTQISNIAVNVSADKITLTGSLVADRVRILSSTLASANTAILLFAVGERVGVRATITDSTATASGNFGATITGGGANLVPAYYDGTNWRIG